MTIRKRRLSSHSFASRPSLIFPTRMASKGKIFALVYWMKSKDTSIVDISKLDRKNLKRGDVLMLPYEETNDEFEGRVLQWSEDKKWLMSLSVSKDGALMPLDGTYNGKKSGIKTQKNNSKSTQELKKLRSSTQKKAEKQVFELMNRIPDDSDAPSEPDSENSDEKTDSNEEESSIKRNSLHDSMKTTVVKRVREAKTDEEEVLVAKRSRIDEQPEIPIDSVATSKTPAVSVEVLGPIVEKILLQLMKKHNLSQPSTSAHPSTSSRSGETEIMSGSGIFVDNVELTFMNRWRQKPAMLVRKLMLYLLGADKLKEMTVRGKGGGDKKDVREPIPPKILAAVKSYVDRKGLYKLSEAEYHRVINLQCGTLRNPNLSSRLNRPPKPSPEDKKLPSDSDDN